MRADYPALAVSASFLAFGAGLLAVAVWPTSCRCTFAGCDSFMELCGCATPQLGLCGTASKLTVMDPSLAQLASWCQ